MELAGRVACSLLVFSAFSAAASAQDCAEAKPLSADEQGAGWIQLSGVQAKPLWTGGVGVEVPDSAWQFEGACLHLANPSKGGSLYSAQTFDDFDLEFEWQISTAGNSGLKYMCVPGWVHPDYYRYLFKPVGGMLAASVAVLIGLLWAIRARRSILARKWGKRGGLAVALLLGLWCVVQAVTLVRGYRHAEQHPPGLEYQVTDDVENADATLLASHRSAALYDLFPPSAPAAAKAREFHRSRVLVRGEQVEHWLDGQKVLEYRFDSPELKTAIAGSKFAGLPQMAQKHSGLLELQNHGDEVWFRNVRIRRLP